MINDNKPLLIRSPRLPKNIEKPQTSYKVVGSPASISGLNFDAGCLLTETLKDAKSHISDLRSQIDAMGMTGIPIDAVLDHCLHHPDIYENPD
jgi:hypothetical protein